MQSVILTFPLVANPTAPSERHSATPRAGHLPPGTNLNVLRGTRLLCLLDYENLTYSMQNIHGQVFSYAALLAQLRRVATDVQPWAALTQPAGRTHAEQELSSAGYRVLAIEQELVREQFQVVKKANADLDLVMLAGFLAARQRFDTVLLGTGDGDLALALARGFKRLPQPVKVITLSVPGSVSHRLRQHHELIDANIAAGRDLCQPQPAIRPLALAASF